MVSHKQLLKILRSLGFTYKRETSNSTIWKKSNSTDRVIVSNNKEHAPLYVKRILIHAGMSRKEVDDFLNQEAKS